MARLSYIVMIIGITWMCVLAQGLHTDKYDDIDVTSILENERLQLQYYGCFMETSLCITAVAKFFKEVFGDAFYTKCIKCTEKQKDIMNMIGDWYIKNKPEQWEALVAKIIENLKKENVGQ